MFRLHELYENLLADMAEISTFASEQGTRDYLDQLAARAYAEIHETRTRRDRIALNLPPAWVHHLRVGTA